MENSEIRKAEILEKSRKSKTDEGVESAENKGSKLADYTVGIFGALLAAFALFNGELAAAWAVLLIISAYGFGLFLTMYRFTKRKTDLFLTFWSAGSIIAMFIMFLAAIYGWWIF